MRTELTEMMGIPYNKKRGPWLTDAEITITEGANCQYYGHTLYKKCFGIQIPKGMWSLEIYEDNTDYFRSIGKDERLYGGDIFLFGRKDLEDFKRLHFAIYGGDFTSSGNPLFLHESVVSQLSCVWQLSQFRQNPRYEVIYAIKRMQPQFFDYHIQSFSSAFEKAVYDIYSSQ